MSAPRGGGGIARTPGVLALAAAFAVALSPERVRAQRTDTDRFVEAAIEALPDPERRAAAVRTLAASGEVGVDRLMRAIRAERPPIARAHLLRALAECKPHAGGVVRELLAACREFEDDAVLPAFEAIAELVPFGRDDVAVLQGEMITALRRRADAGVTDRVRKLVALVNRVRLRANVRWSDSIEALTGKLAERPAIAVAAVQVLGYRGAAARDALPALRAKFPTATIELRGAIARAMLRVDADHPAADVAHLWALKTREVEASARLASIRQLVAGAAALDGPKLEPTLLALITAFGDPDVRVVGEAVTALSTFGARAASTRIDVERLERGHPDKQVRARAKATLRAIRPR